MWSVSMYSPPPQKEGLTFAKPRVSPYPVCLSFGGGVPQGVHLIVHAWSDEGEHPESTK